MTQDQSRLLVDQLCRADAYAERPREIVLHETHISWVFVTERFAYKLKKPLRFDFLDYSTVEQRHAACEAEVRLNRRLAADVYLDVLPITRDEAGLYHVAGAGAIVDWAVRMRRLAEEHRLDVMIRQQRITAADIARVAARLAAFYQSAPALSIDASQYLMALESHVRANLHVLSQAERGLSGNLVRRVHQAQLRLLALAPELLERRVKEGRVIDGHGDLRPEHIYLLETPVAIDCIEFNDEFRQIDVADELAFLAMECDLLGASSIGEHLFESCCRVIGDHPAAPLVPFFKSYRAAVRAKVQALRADQSAGNDRTRALDAALTYLVLADRYHHGQPDPLLVVVGGLMGTGKSTLAGALAEKLGAEVLSTDSIRLELFGRSDQPAGFGEGHYTAEARARVYRELFARSSSRIAQGLSVVLDGTFLDRSVREHAAEMSAAKAAAFFWVRATCPDEVALQRIRHRAEAGSSPSEARPELFAQQQAEATASGEAYIDVKIDTTIALESQVRQVCHAIAGRFPIVR